MVKAGRRLRARPLELRRINEKYYINMFLCYLWVHILFTSKTDRTRLINSASHIFAEFAEYMNIIFIPAYVKCDYKLLFKL